MAKTNSEKQDQTIGQFERTLRNAKYSTPNTKTGIFVNPRKEAPKTEEVRISFYNPNNPLNGFRGKSKDEQDAIRKQMRQIERERKSSK